MPNTNVKRRVAILEKDGIIAAIGMFSHAGYIHAVCNYDPRAAPENKFYRASFETRLEAMKRFNDNVATSRDRGWTVIHNGAPNFG